MKINIQRRVHGIHKIFRNRRLEYYWTIGPLLFLIGISVSPMLYIYLHEATVVGLMKRVIRNQWYWSYRVLVQENRGVWDSLYVNGSLTRCDSWSSNLESNLRWAVSSNDYIHNWRVAGSSDEVLGVLIKFIIEELDSNQQGVLMIDICFLVVIGGFLFSVLLVVVDAMMKFDW